MPRKRNADAAGNTAARGTPSKGLTLKAYRGNVSALLAFDVDPKSAQIRRIRDRVLAAHRQGLHPAQPASFAQGMPAKTTPAQREWTPTTEGPIEKFHWVDYPPTVTKGKFTLKADSDVVKKGSESAIEPGPTSEVSLELWDEGYGNFDLGFTRRATSPRRPMPRASRTPTSSPSHQRSTSTPSRTLGATPGSAPMQAR